MEKIALVFEKVRSGDGEAGHVISDMAPARRERFLQLKNPEQRAQYAASTRALERALFEFTGDRRAALSFRYGENGRPEADGAYLSLAHTEGMAVCAVGRMAVGVDIEPRDRRFSEALKKRVPSLDDWLALEACVKMTGEGLAGMRKYARAGVEMQDADGNRVAYLKFIDIGEYRAAVCCAEEFEI